MFHACSSTWVTQPHWTSSIWAGSTPFRSTSPFTTCAASSSPRMCESVPFFFPIGLRTASTIIAPGLVAPDSDMQETVPRSMLRKNAKIELLKRVPLFERCSKSELQQIALLADEVNLPAGRNLTTEGAPGREFVVLVEGRAEVRRKGRKVRELSDGDFMGEIALIAEVPRTATITTLTPVDILLMTARDFRRLLKEVPSLQPKVMYALATRLPPEFQ